MHRLLRASAWLTNWTRSARLASLSLTLALVTHLPAPLHAHDDPPAASAAPLPLDWPSRVYVSPTLRPLVGNLLARSATFREQIAALARAGRIGVSITLEAGPRDRPARAEIRRYDNGAVIATIRIHSHWDQAELVAHEIEHVLEQLEGVELSRLAREGQKAWLSGGAYETMRAITAGRRVAAEARAGWRRADATPAQSRGSVTSSCAWYLPFLSP